MSFLNNIKQRWTPFWNRLKQSSGLFWFDCFWAVANIGAGLNMFHIAHNGWQYAMSAVNLFLCAPLCAVMARKVWRRDSDIIEANRQFVEFLINMTQEKKDKPNV